MVPISNVAVGQPVEGSWAETISVAKPRAATTANLSTEEKIIAFYLLNTGTGRNAMFVWLSTV